MKINQIYLEASFISFVIHASIILYLLGFFYYESQHSQVELYSSLIIKSIQSAWRKPMNIQDGLVCDLRLSINKNGRIVNVNLIRSSGNLRFDNSALKAVQRAETFSFFKDIPYSLYSTNFKSVVITFNPT